MTGGGRPGRAQHQQAGQNDPGRAEGAFLAFLRGRPAACRPLETARPVNADNHLLAERQETTQTTTRAARDRGLTWLTFHLLGDLKTMTTAFTELLKTPEYRELARLWAATPEEVKKLLIDAVDQAEGRPGLAEPTAEELAKNVAEITALLKPVADRVQGS